MSIVEYIVKSVVGKLGEALNQPPFQEDTFLHGVCEPVRHGIGEQVLRLRCEFRRMQCFLEDADAKELVDRRVKSWVRVVREVANDAEDAIDIFAYKIAPLFSKGGSMGKLKRYALLFTEFKALHDLGRKIERINVRITEITERREVYGIQGITSGEATQSLRRLSSAHVPEPEPDVIGFQEQLKSLIEHLIGGEERRCAVSLVGMGGLGKTTLAMKVYNDRAVKNHFSLRAWISVSQQYSERELLQDVAKQCSVCPVEELQIMNALELRSKILEYLKNRTYFLVMDDIWDCSAWNQLKDAFPDESNGSRILLTTRNREVALYADFGSIPHKPHELPFLTEDESWRLLCKKAFLGQEVGSTPDLESIGREIVKKCGGVPLAIVVIGGLLSENRREASEWQMVLDNISWQFRESRVFDILSLSYYDLPSYMKPCFLYLAIFPEGYQFPASRLIRLWAAEGFLQQRGKVTPEEMGEEILMKLISRNLIQVAEASSSGLIESCRIHDLLRDLCLSKAKEEAFLEVQEWSSTPREGKGRRLALHGADASECTYLDSSTPHLRSIFLFNENRKSISLTGENQEVMQERRQQQLPLMSFKMLRVLDLEEVHVRELPYEIGKLVHLKYIRCSDIVELPESVSHLRKLHTLDLTGCVKLKRLPRGMGGMVSLRYLEIERTDSLECLPTGLGGISWLRSLCKFIVGDEGEGRGGCGIDELQQLNSLQGSLRIQHLERVSSREEAEKAELWNKPHLRRLILSMFGRDDDAEIDRMDSVLEGLRPHANLEELKLFCYTGSKLPSWMQLMPWLRKLELYGCPNLEGLPYHLDSGSLRELLIRDSHRFTSLAESFEHLEKISVIDSSEFFSTGLPHLSNLKTFEIRGFKNETFPDEGWERLVALQTLEIWNCDELKCLPDGLAQLQSLENLIIFGCDQLEWLPEGLGQLKKLKALTISVLEALKCLPESLGQMEPLEHIEISSCDKLKWLPDSLGQLKKLKLLRIQGLQALSCLPDSVGLLESLEHLNIRDLDKLESVPDSLGELTALTQLEIRYCKALRSLPHGLQHLSLLRELYISDCPLLSERCQMEEGEDWPKISHIPCITIDDQRIQ